jgi:HNH endonuclease
MTPQAPASGLNIVAVVGVGLLVWYVYQIASRKREQIRYKIRRTVVALAIYLITAVLLTQQSLPPLESVVVGVLAGMGCAWLLVKPPSSGRRIPAGIRREVIARDLTSKGLKWDRSKHHLDHIVPFSRGGDNSARNLRVVDKDKNLRKGAKMPGFWDFLRK